jgi:hypothetical protein
VGFQGQLQVLEHGELLKHRGLLKLAANAKLRNLRLGVAQQINGAAKEHRTRIRSGLARDDVHHRGLACAVRPNDAAQLAGRNVQGQLVNGLKAIKTNQDSLVSVFFGYLVKHNKVGLIKSIIDKTPDHSTNLTLWNFLVENKLNCKLNQLIVRKE